MPARSRVWVGSAVVVVLALASTWFLIRPGTRSQIGAPAGAPVQSYLRLSVSRDAASGAVDISRAAIVETAVQPLTAMGGFYAVLDGPEGVLAARPFAFPTIEHQEYRDASGAFVMRQDVSLARQSVIVFLPYEPDATTVRLLDVNGNQVAALDPTTVEGVAAARTGAATGVFEALLSVIETPLRAASAADLQAQFPHILFGSSLDDLSATHQEGVEAIIPIDDALDMAPHIGDALFDVLSELRDRSPLLLGSIASISIIEFPDSGVVTMADCSGEPSTAQRGASTVGNQIVINVRDSINNQIEIIGADEIRKNLAHEATHAFTMLLENGGSVVQERLPGDVLARVNELREQFGHLNGVVSGTWGQMQGSAIIAYSGYKGYEGTNYPCVYPGDEGAVEAGFKRGYGARSILEDIATYVEMFYENGFASHPVCQQFSGLSDEVPRPQLLAFAKLNFLRGLELISEADYEACVQDADPANQDGFMINDENYSDGLKAGGVNRDENIQAGREGSRWAVLGSTSSAQALLQIFTRPPAYSPVGFYRLDDTTGWLTAYVQMRGLARRNLITWQPTNTEGSELTRNTRVSTGGFALVVNDQPGDTKGYAFFVPLEDWLARRTGVLDLVWFRLEDN